jgi:hypothetical protein
MCGRGLLNVWQRTFENAWQRHILAEAHFWGLGFRIAQNVHILCGTDF